MENISGNKEIPKRTPLKSPPKGLLPVLAVVISLGLLIAGAVIGIWFNGVVSADNTYCQTTDGYQLITQRKATDVSGNDLFILRGVIATGEGSVGGSKITIPPCGSLDPDIPVVNNLFITLDGKQVFLAAGSVLRDTLPNPTQDPQP